MSANVPRRSDPYLVGIDQPVLLVPADVAVLLWPAIQRWAAEHHAQGATAKLRAVGPVLARWSTVVELYRLGKFSSAPTGGADGADGGRLQRSNGSWLTVRQAADRLDYQVQHVRRLAARGDLEAHKQGRDWQIEEASVEALQAARRSA